MARRRLLVIGIGNPSRTDDGVGHYVVDRLEEWLAAHTTAHGPAGAFAAVDLDHVHQLAPETSDAVFSYDVVVFVDARVGETARSVLLAPITPAFGTTATSHHWSPEAVLALTKQLFGRAPQGFLLSIAGRDFDFGDNLSAETRDEADLAVEWLLRFIRGEDG